jgi:hypothetical protein
MEQAVAESKPRQKRRSISEWRLMLEEWHASGKTADVWCKERGIGRESLRRWGKRLQETDMVPVLVGLHRSPVGSMAPRYGHLRILANGEVELLGEFSDELLRRVLLVVRESI